MCAQELAVRELPLGHLAMHAMSIGGRRAHQEVPRRDDSRDNIPEYSGGGRREGRQGGRDTKEQDGEWHGIRSHHASVRIIKGGGGDEGALATAFAAVDRQQIPPRMSGDANCDLPGVCARDRGRAQRLNTADVLWRRASSTCPPLSSLLLLSLIFLGGAGSHLGPRGVGAISYSPTCNATHYHSAKPLINSSSVNTKSFSPNGNISRESLAAPPFSDNYNTVPTVVACEVVFPNAAQDMMIWHFGEGYDSASIAKGAWLGFRDAAVSYTAFPGVRQAEWL